MYAIPSCDICETITNTITNDAVYQLSWKLSYDNPQALQIVLLVTSVSTDSG